MAITITTVSPNNTEVSYVVPDDARKITMTTEASDVDFRGTTTSGTGFRLPPDHPITLQDPNLVGSTLYWHSASSVTVDIMVETGLLS